jgi:hypothetical protein
MSRDRNETASLDRKVSRRWVLRSAACATAGVAAASTVNLDVAEARRADIASAPDHDPTTGEIFDRDRHHHWDTV